MLQDRMVRVFGKPASLTRMHASLQVFHDLNYRSYKNSQALLCHLQLIDDTLILTIFTIGPVKEDASIYPFHRSNVRKTFLPDRSFDFGLNDIRHLPEMALTVSSEVERSDQEVNIGTVHSLRTVKYFSNVGAVECREKIRAPFPTDPSYTANIFVSQERMANRGNVLLTFVRGLRNYPKSWRKDCVRYENIKYHPRAKDHVDATVIPSKVFMVERVKPFKGNPYWERDTLEKLGFKEDENEPVFIKNTPEMCAMLWKVKHLINIVPLRLPEKLPTVDDNTEVYIHENGTIHITGKIDPARYQATIEAQTSIKRMNYDTIKEKLRLRWIAGILI